MSAGSGTNRLPELLITLTVAGIILFVGMMAVSGVIDTTTDGGGTDDVETAALLEGTDWTTIDDTIGTQEAVYDSRGYAVELAAANDSYVRSTKRIDVQTTSNWTVSLWASYASTTDRMTALSLDGRIDISYNGSSGNWTAWHYDDGDRASYQVNVSATSDPGDLENIIVTRDGDTLTIYANNTAGESATLDGSGSVDAPLNTTSWDGRLEEVRASAVAWNNSIRQSHYDDPIAPLGVNQTARVMFDEPYRDQQLLFYNPGSVAYQNVSFVDGHAGQELSDGGLISSGDYDWRDRGPQIQAVDGERLDGAPVAYVDYAEQGRVADLRDSFSSALGLAGLLFIILPLGVIVLYIQSTRR